MKRLVLLGVGNVATAVNSRAREYEEVVGTTRSTERQDLIASRGMTPFLLSPASYRQLQTLIQGSDLLVSFPPDIETERDLATLSIDANKIVYISSTGVYGKMRGRIDETSPVDRSDVNAAARLNAEDIWRNLGAVVLRAAGLYGVNTGLHLRLRQSDYRLVGDGNRFVSRIHLDDLARIVLAAFSCAQPGALYVVADKMPALQSEVVTWICHQLNIAVPAFAQEKESILTRQADRQIIASKVLSDLQIELAYPSYKEGYAQCMAL